VIFEAYYGGNTALSAKIKREHGRLIAAVISTGRGETDEKSIIGHYSGNDSDVCVGADPPAWTAADEDRRDHAAAATGYYNHDNDNDRR
jgi:hypothetical protein